MICAGAGRIADNRSSCETVKVRSKAWITFLECFDSIEGIIPAGKTADVALAAPTDSGSRGRREETLRILPDSIFSIEGEGFDGPPVKNTGLAGRGRGLTEKFPLLCGGVTGFISATGITVLLIRWSDAGDNGFKLTGRVIDLFTRGREAWAGSTGWAPSGILGGGKGFKGFDGRVLALLPIFGARAI